MKIIQLIVVFCFLLQAPAFSQVATNGDYRSAATGNWGTLATWEVRAAGVWAAAAALPTATSNVYIQQGHTVTVNIAAAVCQDLQVNFTSGVLSIGANTLSVNGKLRSYTGTPVTGAADGVFYSSQADNSTNSTTIITSTSGYLKFVGNSRAITTSNLVWGGGTTGLAVEFALNAGQTGSLATTFKAKEFIFSSGTITTTQRIAPDAGSSNSGILIIKNGAALISSQTGTATGGQVISRTGTGKCLQVTIEAGGTLELTGADPRMDVTSFVNNGNVIYNRNGVQNLLQRSGNDLSVATQYTNYFNLTIRGSNTKTIPASYALAIAAGGSFTENGTATCILAAGVGSSLSYGAGATFISSSSGNVTLTATSPEWPAASGPDNVTVTSSTLAYTPNLSAFQVFSYSLIANVATINTTAPHGFTAGSVVTITNVFPCDTLFNGTYTLLSGSGTTMTYTPVNPNGYTIPLELATAPFGAVTNAPLTRTIPGTLRLNGGSFNIGSGNKLIMANGSTVVRSSTSGSLVINSGFYSVGAAAGDLVNITINASGTVAGSGEMNNAPTPGGFGNLTITSTAKYEVGGGRQVVNLINDGDLTLKPNTGLIFTIYGNISGTGVITSAGTPNVASITIGVTGTPSVAINKGYAGILRFNQTIPGTTNSFKNLKSERIPDPVGTPTVTIANNVIVNGTYNQSKGIVELASGATLTLAGTAGNFGATLRGNNNANIVINGTGALGNLYFDQTTPGTTNLFNNLTLNRAVSGSATMKDDVIFGGTVTLTNGSLDVWNNVTLEIAGSFNNNSGTGTIGGLADNTTSNLPNLKVSGTGSTFNALKFTPGFTEFKDFTVNRSVAVDAAAGNGLRIQGNLNLSGASTTLTTSDNITLRSTAAGTASVPSVAGITTPFVGSFTVERYIPANANRAWRLLAIPTNTTQTINATLQNGQAAGVQGPAGMGTWVTNKTSSAVANGYDAQSPGNHSLMKYNASTNKWDSIITPTTSTPIASDAGYMVFIRGDRTATNLYSTITPTTISTKGPLKTGDYPSAPLNVGADRYQAIGNPYASAIDLRSIVRTGGTDAIFYVWDPKILPLGGFQTLTFNGTNYIITPGGGSYGASGSVMDTAQSGQAFMAHATGVPGTVQFTEGCKTTGNRNVFRPASAGNSAGQLITNLYTVNSDNTIEISDGNMVVFDDRYSKSIDGVDAKKLVNFGENFGINKYGETLAVDKTEQPGISDTVYYNFTKPKAKNYRIQITASNLNHPNLLGKLEDNYIGTSIPVDLNGTTTYDFTPIATAPGSYAVDRFKLVMYQSGETPVNQIVLNAEKENNNVAVSWKAGNQINIQQYDVERSSDGINFTKMSTTEATGGNGATIGYSWLDENVFRGDVFYRIKIVAKSGDIAYSNIVKVKMGKAASGITIYPNLISNKTINLQFTDATKGTYSLVLVNDAGQTVMTSKIMHIGGSGVQNIALGKEVNNGSYRLQIVKPGNRKTAIPLVVID